MISLSVETSSRIMAYLNEVRGECPAEFLPVFSQLEEQVSALRLEEGLLAEVVALLCARTSARQKEDGRKISKKKQKKIDRAQRDLVVVLNELQTQERMIQSRRMRR